MTYVLAWKTDSDVFLAADSALTTTNPNSDRHNLERSSFGKEHIFEDNRVVEERTLKLFLKNNIGIAIAGRYETAIAMVGTFYEKINEGMSPREALNWTVFTHAPALRDGVVQLTVAYFDEQPSLLCFNGGEVVDNQDVVHLGSAPPHYREINEGWLRDLPTLAGNRADMQLAAMLGILQSHGVLNPTLRAGIGGAFAGLRISRQGGTWQPDVLFIEYGTRRLVSTCIQNDCFIVNSPILGESRCFLTFIPPRTRESLMEQTGQAIEQARAMKNSGLFDYVFIMSTNVRSLTLIHMDKKLRHLLLWIEPFVEEGGITGTNIKIFPRLRAIINRTDQGIVMVPYAESTETEIPHERRITREIRPEN